MILRDLLATATYVAGKTPEEMATILNAAATAEDGTAASLSPAMENLGRDATAADVADALATELEIEARAIRGTTTDGVNWTFGGMADRDAAASQFHAKGKMTTNSGDTGLIVG